MTGGSARLDDSKYDDFKLRSSSSHVSEHANVNVLDVQSSKGSWVYNANLSSSQSPEIKNQLKHIKSQSLEEKIDFFEKPEAEEFENLESIEESSKRDFDHIQRVKEDPTLQSCQLQSLQFDEELSHELELPIQSPTSPTSRLSYLSYTNTAVPQLHQPTSASPNKRYMNSTNVIDFENLPDIPDN